MSPLQKLNLPLFTLLTITGRTLIGYIIVFVVGALIGTVLYLLYRSNRKPIKLKIPLYPFFQSEGRSAEFFLPPDLPDKDTSALYACSYNYEDLIATEFGEMVIQAFKHEGWTNIQAISDSKEEAATYIGIDETGKLARVEIHHRTTEIGLPIIQKFHTTVLKGTIQRALMVTNSDFAKQAIEYAHEVHIELLNGRQFTSQCEDILDKTAKPDRMTRPLNRESIEISVRKFIDKSIFSFPEPPSTLLSEINVADIKYSPIEYHQFTLGQQFANPTRTWVWKMNYPDHLLVHHSSKNWHIIENQPRCVSYSLDHQLKLLDKEKIGYSISAPLPVNKISTIRQKIQEMTSTEKMVTDRERGNHTMKCTPDETNIEINASAIFWGSNLEVDTTIGRDTKFRLGLHEGKVSQILNQDGGVDLKEKTTALCQECLTLTGGIKYVRNLDYCVHCGKTLCQKCGHTENKFLVKKTRWCKECWTKILNGEYGKKKSKKALQRVKRAFKEWQER